MVNTNFEKKSSRNEMLVWVSCGPGGGCDEQLTVTPF